ncbi:MAG TPA: hypothetical protein VGO11_07460 [Chthoniobacteraceae bacterium]|jgi:dienelactone hydrolase|nr:hypothetical protein [Chthoniobacteraceae bacterium]
MKRLFPLLVLFVAVSLRAEEPLPGTALLDSQLPPEARSDAMVAGIGKWLHREADRQTADRHQRWATPARGDEWDKFAAEMRKELAIVLGTETNRAAPLLERSEGGRVRWTVFEGVYGEGVAYGPEPKVDDVIGALIVVPDTNETPEECLLARRLAAQGFSVIVPVLIDRGSEFAGNEAVKMTNESNREWIYRQSFEMGRTLLGYEVQKVLALADALKGDLQVAGSGDGVAIALRAAALSPRCKLALLSGGFGAHRAYEQEPIDRNLFGAWKDFGDAELGALVGLPLYVEYGRGAPPKTPAPLPGQAAPGVAIQPSRTEVQNEMLRRDGYGWNKYNDHTVVLENAVDKISEPMAGVKVPWGPNEPPVPARLVSPEFARERQRRAVRELEQFTQRLVPQAERQRNSDIWAKVGTPEWPVTRAVLKERLWASIGKLPADRLPSNARTRRILDAPKWTAYEVMLDVMPDVFAWGYLLVPKDLQPGERRPVVVCQHGLEGLPGDTVTQDPKEKGFVYYQGFAAQLADLGYITYAPHNPYRGHDSFRVLQRQANPLGLSLFSFIIAQHDVTTAWLAGLPFVDPKRIGFYGLSYGGKTAMRVPALVDRYALSICSGDFNEWIRKNVSVEERISYMFTGEYEMFEWNLGWNANYAEMAMLIAPRPFMVERGHKDGVGTDEWVGYEYAKVQRGYLRLGVPERTTIEWFDGPHMINGKGTFEFLRRHLGPAQR